MAGCIHICVCVFSIHMKRVERTKAERVFPQTGLPVWGSYSLDRVACLGRMILTVSPGLRPQSVGSGWSHDSYTCLSFVSHLSPTLGLVVRMISLHFSSHLSFICLPLNSHSGSGWSHDFPSLVSQFVFHLSPTWLPLWVVLVA